MMGGVRISMYNTKAMSVWIKRRRYVYGLAATVLNQMIILQLTDLSLIGSEQENYI